MSIKEVPAPTREDLEQLLWSDPVSAEFESDAMGIILAADGDAADKAQELMDVVSGEVGDPFRGGEDDEAENLRDLACTAKRGAIMLLHAAWFAEQEAMKVEKAES